MATLLQVFLNALLAAAIYALVAAGLSFLYATARIFHLAHGVVVLGAGYAFWWGWRGLGWPPALALLFALALAALLGVASNELVYERLKTRGARGLGYLIATLAMLMLGTAFALGLFGAAPRTFRFQTRSIAFAGVYLTVLQLVTMAAAAALLGAFYWLTHYTRFGKAMRATADNEQVAEVLGIDTRRVRRLAFALSSALAAAAGVLVGLEFNLDPNMGVGLAVRGFAAAVIGGVGSFGGAIVGSVLIGVLEQGVVWFWGAGWRHAATFALLFLVLLLRPQGLFGRRA